MRRETLFSCVSKTVDNPIKFPIIYIEKTSHFLMVDSTKKHKSMQQSNPKNYSSVALKILERFLALRNVKMQKTKKIAFQGGF